MLTVLEELMVHSYSNKEIPLAYPDPLFAASKEEITELRKLKRSIRTLKTTEAKERAIEKLNNLQATIRERHPATATDAEVRSIIAEGSKGV